MICVCMCVCLKIFRTNFLSENILAILTLHNYINMHKSFTLYPPSIQWLEHISDRDKIPIRHALTEGEVKFGNYFVDAYFEDVCV